MMGRFKKDLPIKKVFTIKYFTFFMSFCCVLIIISFMSVSAYAQNEKTISEDGIGLPIVIGFKTDIFNENEIINVNAAVDYWIQEVSAQTGHPAIAKIYADLDSVICDLQEDKIDLMHTLSIDYCKISEKTQVELAYARVVYKKKTQKYLILVHSDSEITEINELKGKTIAVRKSSSFGMLYLNTLLLKNKLPESEHFFSTINEKDKTSRAILSVFFKTDDACIVIEEAYNALVELNPQIGNDLRIIDSSPEYVNIVAFFRKDYADRSKKIALKILLRLHDIPKGDQLLKYLYTEQLEVIDESDLINVRELNNIYTNLKGNNSTDKK